MLSEHFKVVKFTFNVDDMTYTMSVVVPNDGTVDAREKLRNHLARIINEINDDLKQNPSQKV